jgi:pimeloyl-ACP methyl ester carboxylesterase
MIASHPAQAKGCVIALHCSLSSGRQWTKLAAELDSTHQLVSPDISGYGSNPPPMGLPTTLAGEVERLAEALDRIEGPFHLVGHSYGGAIAFKIATNPVYADRVRSLTLIEPVLPTLLKENRADRRLHDLFAQMAGNVSRDLWRGMTMEAVDRFMSYWTGSEPAQELSVEARLRLIERIGKVAYDFAAILSEENVTAAASRIGTPTLLLSGGLSPYLTQRVVGRLASVIPDADTHHIRAAGHMLPITHAKVANPLIVRHIQRVDDLATVPLASEPAACAWPARPKLVRTPK